MITPADQIKAARIRMQIDAGREAQLFWSTKRDRSWSEKRSISFDLIPDGAFHEYTIELGDHPEWKGLIWQFRFDPGDAPARFAIDWFDATPYGTDESM